MKYQSLIKKLMITLSVLSFNVQASIFITPKAPSINAAAYLVVDHNSGVVIASSDADELRAPASLTKLMTAYVVFQLIKDGRVGLNDDVRISKKAWKTGGSKSFVEVGKTIKLETLLQGMIIQSGNDSAVALAEHIAGTEGTFATYMNEYAKELGMLSSNFENASGLPVKDNKQNVTARDMAKLASAIIRDFPQFYPWFSQKEFSYHGIKQRNRNKLLWSDHTVDGLKTGHTKRAGYNLVVSAKRVDDMRLISVVLGSTGTQARAEQTQTLLDYGFRFYETKKISEISNKIPIPSSTKKAIKVGFNHPQAITLPRGQYRLSQQAIELNNNLAAPISKGDNIGHFIIKFEGNVLAKLPIIALEDAPESGFFSRLLDKIGL
ncbi:MAG: serine-type D-Ala-D-Ala carboxypeptidase [Gammaproteobacteria bacterium]|uniref:serine-type D-Ala-D-Ala carboxypeptidase n=1 Tax=endosymbiont of Bathymodiolus septemdierum str. Myojin knoll TaxID=1303921 RepID=A0A0P0UR32_9GAMM|nr:D-alanyl-D-alanine carboxypeptidase family protein [Bathymodiolus septemdierum thioautotrophic gill symbiont]RUA04632.1 MAG: serine-type D-Ala-D-Ala carboxypeptidase [Gammaproteobacteria bacterium]BAS67550.1 D-alanyl-D-alanine carboxypeptidase (penicillin-binding protein 5/6) [endosymbiont of Bathymodiolus septemdierum str. Myojin knoll]